MWLTTGRPQGPEEKRGVIEADSDRAGLGERQLLCLRATVYGRCLAKLNTEDSYQLGSPLQNGRLQNSVLGA